MSNHQVLDNITHQDVKILTQHHPKFGDVHSYASVVPVELEFAQADYPIVFRKNHSGSFEAIVLLGLEQEENLFLDDNGWDAHYVPLSIQRRPFMIGFQMQDGVEQPVVHIDMDSPRISQDNGESIFMPHGGQSGYLQEVSGVLKALHDGHNELTTFVNALNEMQLIEKVDISVTLNNGEKMVVDDLFTIHQENLAALDVDSLGKLHHQGFLKYAYMMIASLSNLTKLIERKNKSLQA